MRPLALLLVLLPASCGSAPKPEATTAAAPAAPGSFEEQVQNGEKTYAATCATCHGASLKGGNRAPTLLGKKSLAKNAKETFLYIKGNMPPDGPGALSDTDFWNVTAFLVKKHNWPVSARLSLDNAESVKP